MSCEILPNPLYPSGHSMGGFCHAALHPIELYRNKLTGFIGLF